MKKLVLLISLIVSGCLFLLTLPTSAQCPNLNFNMGNFTYWQCYLGDCGNGTANISTSSWTPGRHTIMNGPQLLAAGQLLDERCMKIKKVPDGFALAAKLGNESTGAEMEAIEYTLTVDSNSSLLMLHFAWVMEDPSHAPSEQPLFSLTIKDSVGNTIPSNILPCSFFNFIASAGLEGLACTGSVLGRDWTTVGYSLEPMIGRTIKIYFETRDCTLSGHYGYAYVVAECRSMAIDLMFCEGQTAARFRAPDGFQRYTWTRSIGQMPPNSSGVGRPFQNLTLTDPFDEEVVTCEMESALKQECSATVKTVVKKTSIDATFGYGVMRNGGVPFLSHNNQNWYDTCGRTATFVDRSKVVNSKQANRSWYIHGLKDLAIPRDSMVTITFPDPGEKGLDSVRYLVRLTVGAENGCTDTSGNFAEHTITIYASPQVEIEGPTEICIGKSEPLAAKTVRSQFASRTWTWQDGSGNPQTRYNDSIIYITEPAIYYLESIDVQGCIVRDTHIVTPLSPKMDTEEHSTSCFGGKDGWFTHGPITGASSSGFRYAVWLVYDTNMWPLLSSPWKYDSAKNAYTDIAVESGSAYMNLPAGSYIFEGLDYDSCDFLKEVRIVEPPLLELFSKHEPTTCGLDNGTIILTATGGTPPYIYRIEKGGRTIAEINTAITTVDSAKFTGLAAGTYDISVTDVGGRFNEIGGSTCTTRDTITVTALPAPYIDVTVTDETCESKNGSIFIQPINARQPMVFIWDGDTTYNTTHGKLSKGTYRLKFVDGYNCIIDSTIKVDAHPTPTVSIAITPETCGRKDGAITLTVNSALPSTVKYQWIGRTETTPKLTGLTAKTYNVTITDSFCVVEKTIEVPHIDGPVANFQTTTYSVPSNSNFVLTDISKGTVNIWNWDMGDGNTQTGKVVYYSYGTAGDYTVLLQVIDENNCTDTTSNVMHVYDELTVFIPNMFTPNSDNLNEIWMPAMTEYVEEGYQLSVFDRWGQRIFHTTNPKEGWNGTSTDGKIVANNTVYSYRLIVRDFAGQEYEFVGQVTVIR